MKSKTYNTARTEQKPNTKIVERGKIDSRNTQIHDVTHKYMTSHFHYLYYISSDFIKICVVCSIFIFLFSI